MPNRPCAAIDRADKPAPELHVHPIELETRNEPLRRAQSDLAAARDRDLDRSDFAPVGYFTLDKAGAILDCNLTGAEMLGKRRTVLKGSELSPALAEGGGRERVAAIKWLVRRARLLGGRPEIDAPRDHTAWVGVGLSLPTVSHAHAGVHGGLCDE